jgi:hypothetical protein
LLAGEPARLPSGDQVGDLAREGAGLVEVGSRLSGTVT